MMEHILELYIANGRGAFTSSAKWLEQVTGSYFCPHCHGIYESIKHLDAVVHNKERKSDVDLIAVNCHRVTPLSTHFVEVVGISLLEKSASLGKLLDEDGFAHERYWTAIPKQNNVVLRGREKSHVGLCRECSRLLYWPIGAEYVLKLELPEIPLFLSNGSVFCTPEFYEQRLSKAKLRYVAIRKIPIREEPLDGLPTSTRELKEFLKSSGIYK